MRRLVLKSNLKLEGPVSLSLNFLGGAASAEGVGAQTLRPWEIASSHTDSTVTLISLCTRCYKYRLNVRILSYRSEASIDVGFQCIKHKSAQRRL